MLGAILPEWPPTSCLRRSDVVRLSAKAIAISRTLNNSPLLVSSAFNKCISQNHRRTLPVLLNNAKTTNIKYVSGISSPHSNTSVCTVHSTYVYGLWRQIRPISAGEFGHPMSQATHSHSHCLRHFANGIDGTDNDTYNLCKYDGGTLCGVRRVARNRWQHGGHHQRRGDRRLNANGSALNAPTVEKI